MKKMFYSTLAVTNIKKNRQTYIPYILSCIGTIMMFYIMASMRHNPGLNKIIGGENLKIILNFGIYVIGFFSIIFLFYTNSFLIKRRKKEFGLYNILGMEKKHISKVTFFETLYVGILSLGIGIPGGVLLSKLMFLLLLKIVDYQVQFGFEISFKALIATLVLFSGIFLVSFLNTVRQVHLSKPIDLLKGGQVGEKEPKSSWLLAVIGAICLGIGYYIALTTKSPMTAMSMFFFAVIMVIIGTYALFISGSIYILKLLRKNKKYYYQTKHFTTVSGMIYRMKQNSAGLANICILATVVLVMLSTTVSMYIGMENILRTRYERNVIVSGQSMTKAQIKQADKIIEEVTGKMGIKPKDTIHYSSIDLYMQRKGNDFTVYDEGDNALTIADISSVNVLSLGEYNKIMGENKTLSQGEVLLYTIKGEIKENNLKIGDKSFSIKERLKDLNISKRDSSILTEGYCIVVYDENIQSQLLPMDKNRKLIEGLSYNYGFDVQGDSSTQVALSTAIGSALEKAGLNVRSECAEAGRKDFYAIYGGLLFLGLFLGILFIMATVLIIYYKQISEGYDDKERFEIMQKVGMSREEVKKSIQSQVLTVFFLPLVLAGIHVAFSFKVIVKLLLLLNLTDVSLFATCTVATFLVFAMFYAAVYGLTARTYYRIVK